MRRVIYSMFMLFLLSSCIGRKPIPASAPSPTVIPSPAVSQGQDSTLEPSTASISSPTPVSLSLILAEFPLFVGTTWEYSAEIIYQDPNDSSKLLSWTGFVTDRIVEKRTEDGGKLIFTVQEAMDPLPPEQVWRRPQTFEYILAGNDVYKGSMKVYQYQLQDMQSWPAFEGTGYEMIVQLLGEVSTPYGTFDSCFSLMLATNPDTTVDTFCPGIGFVAHSYIHHGTPQEEKFVLLSYTPGQP